jgi:exonuclease VII small subunit
MNRVIKILESVKVAVRHNIHSLEKGMKYYRISKHKMKHNKDLKENRKYLRELNKAVKILNEHDKTTVKKEIH